MAMASLSDNAIAVIGVAVCILFIGCVLIPTVDHASIIETVTEGGDVITEESEFSALFGLIPILCILGMAYFLIKRLY